MLTIFEKSFESTTSFKDKLTFLNGSAYPMSFRGTVDELQPVVGKIRLLLGSSQSRLEGLALLKCVLGQCCPEVFAKNSLTWVQLTIEVLKSNDSYAAKNLAFHILSMIISNLSQNPSVRDEVTDKIFPVLIPLLLKSSQEDEESFASAVKCLSICMKHFSRAFRAHKEKIEEFLVKQLDTFLLADIDVIADCFVELSACGESGKNPKVYRENWHHLLSKMTNTLDLLLNDLIDFEDDSEKVDILNTFEMYLPPQTEDSHSNVLMQSRQFVTLSKCLAKLISSPSHHIVKIPIIPLLSFLHRILKVSPANLRNKPEYYFIATFLPSMQDSAFSILEALILSCRAYITKYAAYITALFTEALKISNGFKYPKSLYRYTIFKALNTWIACLGGNGSIEIAKDPVLISELLSDIKPEVLSKEQNLSCLSAETLSNNVSDLNTSLCIIALKVLSNIICSVGSFLEKKTHEDINTTILYILNDIQHQHAHPLYSNGKCRKKLYSLLLDTVVNPTHQNQQLQQSIRVFKIGLQDPDVMVAKTCRKAISTCKSILHQQRSAPRPLSVQKENSASREFLSVTPFPVSTHENTNIWLNNGPMHGDMLVEKAHPSTSHSTGDNASMHNMLCDDLPHIVESYSSREGDCNGNDHVLQNSSHMEEESIDESDDEDEEEEPQFAGEVIQFHHSKSPPPYISQGTLLSHHNQHLLPSTSQDEYIEPLANSSPVKSQECNSMVVQQNGLYNSSEELDCEIESEVVEPSSSKRSLMSVDSPSKKQRVMSVEDEESEDGIEEDDAADDEEEEQYDDDEDEEEVEEEEENVEDDDEECEPNAIEMMQDFVPHSPDEVQPIQLV